MALLSDAEPDSDCPKDPPVFGREPANLKPRSRAGLTSPRGSQTGAQFLFFLVSGGPAPKCRAGTDRPAPTQTEAGDTATQGRPLPGPVMLTIVDLRLSALLAAQAAP